jgi:WD40 repeat protein
VAYPGYAFAATGGAAPLSWSESGSLPAGLVLSTSGDLSGTPIYAGTFPISVTVTDSSVPPLTTSVPVTLKVVAAPNAFTLLWAHLTVARSGHTATLLTSGKVLFTGGGNGKADPSAEVYDPAADTFTATAGAMTEARINHTAALLGDSSLPDYGKVLIVGSNDTTAELYDPTSERFSATGSMKHPRISPTATLLAGSGPNAGKVLIVGGNTAAGDLIAELYDPATGTFSDTGSTTILRTGHTATLLTTGPLAGQVLIAGGNSDIAELYSPVTETFVQTGGVTAPSGEVTATPLGQQDGAILNGNVLFVGSNGGSVVYDLGTQSFTTVGSWPAPTRFHETAGHTASLRNNGSVLVAGGSWRANCGAVNNSTKAAALFAAETESFTATADLSISRVGHTATTLADGSVLIAGGTDSSSDLAPFPDWHCASNTKVLAAVEVYP